MQDIWSICAWIAERLDKVRRDVTNLGEGQS